jgi:hypothetical protein
VKKLRLSAVRLIGFHNYEDVLIRVRGDLFVVGANESGKTTLLDAVHLALSGEQDLDWNAAASLAGPRRSGRTLQGIILRANMAGQSTRPGGSIGYAVVELEPVESNGGPTSLVFGASAMDMHTQVQKWGAVVTRRAEDLSLTELQPDGTQRIFDRDEFEARLNHRVYKGPRGLGDYRSTVADKLFKSREQFDEVTRLWRTAKSYREIASTAQSIGEVFRQVLPAPDPEPFQKIAKGFRDIAGIESELQELSRDVEALHRLRTLLEETCDARETFRRYAYVRESWSVRDHQVSLQQTRTQRDEARAQIADLRQRITRNDGQNSVIREQLAILRESDSYKLLASLEAKEEERRRGDRRITDLRGKLEYEQARINSSQVDCDQKRQSVAQVLVDVRSGLDRICRRLTDGTPEIAAGVRLLSSRLPSQPEEPLDVESISSDVVSVRKRLIDAVTLTDERMRDMDRQKHELEEKLSEANLQLDRLEQFDDLVPSLSGLDEILLRLQREGIGCALLFQHLEWQPSATAELQSAVEAALGEARLATIVVPPEQTEAAHEIVLSAGQGLRILDSVPVDFGMIGVPGEPRLLDFLTISEPRVHAHLEATVGAMVLHREMPPDGVNAEWFLTDGTIGERGTRWQLELAEPCWIGPRRRQEIRQREQQRLQDSVRTLQEQMTVLEVDAAQLQSALQNLRDSRDTLDQLALPSSIALPLSDWRHVAEFMAELSQRIVERTTELEAALSHQEELLQLIAGLQSQIAGTDAADIKEQVDLLELQKKKLDDELRRDEVALQTTQNTVTDLSHCITTCESQSAEAQRRLDAARDSLLAVLPTDQTGDLDHYVFETKRGSQLKPENLADNISRARDQEVELKTKLSGADGVLSDKLAIRYSFRLEDDDALLAIRDRGNQELDAILEERRDQERQMKESLSKKTRELFETIFARDLTERLRADLAQIRRTLVEINRKLQPLVFGHCRFQLTMRHLADYRPLVELIERQAVLSPEHRDELRHYLEDRRDQLLDEEAVPAFLDYRNWFDYSFKLEHVDSTIQESLGSEDMVRGSVGAQTTHNYLLLMAQAALLFDRCEARLRLLMLDDAFYGLDLQRKELLLRCGKQLGLDFVIATPDLDGTIQEHAGDSTTLLVESDGQGSLSALPFEWEQLPPQRELFAEPRPDAVLGAKEPVP